MAFMRLFSGLLTLCFCCAAQATSLRYLNLQQLVDASDLVVRGRAVHQTSFWQGHRIVTRVRVAVDEVWVGRVPASQEVEFLTLGGTVDGIGQRVDGAAVVPHGEDVVVQLARGQDQTLWPVGLAQGVWLLSPPPPVTSGPIHISRPATDRLVVARGGIASPMPQDLHALKAAVLEAAHGR
jgi:hypothetical protein